MKKIFLLLVLFCFASPVFAEAIAPQWAEFCPPKYLTAEYKKPTLKDYWFSFSREPKNYWANRRTSFENEVLTCNETKDKASCYIQIRQLEEYKTAQYNQQKRMETANTLNSINTINTFQANSNLNNINNNLNNINNNLNGIRYGY